MRPDPPLPDLDKESNISAVGDFIRSQTRLSLEVPMVIVALSTGMISVLEPTRKELSDPLATLDPPARCSALLSVTVLLSHGASSLAAISSRLASSSSSTWCLPLSGDMLSLLNCLSETELSCPSTGTGGVGGLQRPSSTPQLVSLYETLGGATCLASLSFCLLRTSLTSTHL